MFVAEEGAGAEEADVALERDVLEPHARVRHADRYVVLIALDLDVAIGRALGAREPVDVDLLVLDGKALVLTDRNLKSAALLANGLDRVVDLSKRRCDAPILHRERGCLVHPEERLPWKVARALRNGRGRDRCARRARELAWLEPAPAPTDQHRQWDQDSDELL
jgi:hypothetical protein